MGILDAGAVAIALKAPPSLEVSVVPFFPCRRESRSRFPERHRCDAGALGSSEDSQITKSPLRLWAFFLHPVLPNPSAVAPLDWIPPFCFVYTGHLPMRHHTLAEGQPTARLCRTSSAVLTISNAFFFLRGRHERETRTAGSTAQCPVKPSSPLR